MSIETPPGPLPVSADVERDEATVHAALPSKLEEMEHRRQSHAVKLLLKNVRLLFTMVRDRRFRMTLRTKAIIIGALVYFIVPIDAVPDFLPVIGYLDDAGVISAVVHALVDEIRAYESYRTGGLVS
ncbi:MAG: YkvA family protein [Candidatus Kapaibacterium sp.]